MSMTNTFESDLLSHIFTNLAITLVGDAAGLLPSAAAGNIYVSLHTADPGEGGDQTTSETSYTGYARISVVRSAVGWTVSGTAPTKVENAAVVTFGLCTAGSPTITHFGVGTDASAGGKLIVSGALTAPLSVSPGIIPQFNAGALSVTAD